MTGAIAPLNDLSGWARGNLLVIVLLVLGAILLTRLAEWSRGRFMAHIDARANDDDELVRSEAAKHRHVVAQVVTWHVLGALHPGAPGAPRPAREFELVRHQSLPDRAGARAHPDLARSDPVTQPVAHGEPLGHADQRLADAGRVTDHAAVRP